MEFSQPIVTCPMCQGSSWKIFTMAVSCCRCGLSYKAPEVFKVQTSLIPESVPSPEILRTLMIIDGVEK